jgi:mono/diheme cytochrome c family protein
MKKRKEVCFMKKRFICGSTASLAGVLLFVAISSAAGEVDRGKTIYENKCQMCHGANGKGDGPAAAAFNPKPQNFTDPKFWEKKDVDNLITNTIEQGHGLMPAVTLQPGEIKDVIDYISHTFKPGSK